MRINVGYSPNHSRQRLAFLDRLPPSRRESVTEALNLSDNKALNQLLEHFDDPDSSDGIIAMIMSQEAKDDTFTGAAGIGYRAFSPKKGLRKSHEDFNKHHMIADDAFIYPEKEQDLLELLSIAHEIDFNEGKPVRELDKNNPFYQRIQRSIDSRSNSSKKNLYAEGGIIGNRSKHPDLPPLTQEIIDNAPAQFTFDNVMGNERWETPVSSPDRLNNRPGLPIEHKDAFNNAPQKGRELGNRMLGSNIKNSILRSEDDPAKVMGLLVGNAMEKEYAFRKKYGQSPQEVMSEFNMVYRDDQVEMPSFYGELMPLSNPERDKRKQ